MQQDADAYLDAFMNGFEFVLLAIRGRIQVDHVGEAEKQRLEAFLDEYTRIVHAYRTRREAPAPGLAIEGKLRAELAAIAAN